jgi:hypothetical protein
MIKPTAHFEAAAPGNSVNFNGQQLAAAFVPMFDGLAVQVQQPSPDMAPGQ